MKYLETYNLNENQIKEIEDEINNSNIDISLFMDYPEIITKILDLFVSIGVTNIYGILMANPEMFGLNYEYIESRVNSYENKKELAELLNIDAENLKLIELY